MDTPTWLVAFGESDRCRGAARFGNWIAAHGRAGGWNVRAVHVLRRGVENAYVPDDLLEERERGARRRVAAEIVEAGAASSLRSVEFVHARTPEQGLRRAAEDARVMGVVIGRRAPADAFALVRLGRVARRLLRELEAPLVVVNPALPPGRLTSGPILVATDLTYGCAVAASFAQRIAAAVGRPATLLHVVTPLMGGSRLAPPPTGRLSDTTASVAERARVSLRRWADAHGLGGMGRAVEVGPTALTLLRAADELDACLIACGTRHLALHQRVLDRSVSTQLAAHAERPVLVVPEPATAAA